MFLLKAMDTSCIIRQNIIKLQWKVFSLLFFSSGHHSFGQTTQAEGAGTERPPLRPQPGLLPV